MLGGLELFELMQHTFERLKFKEQALIFGSRLAIL
jgi:hypothetical protein